MASRFQNKFKKQSGVQKRAENVRDERPVSVGNQLLNFNFKDLDSVQCPPGQTVEEWQEQGLLSALIEKLKNLSNMTLNEALQQQQIKIYGDFPPKSDFKSPKHLKGKVKWSVIMNVKRQKCRVAGYVDGNTFFIVFLDREHKFWKTEKKHT